MKTKLMALEALKKLDAYSSQFSHDQTGHKKLEFAREAIAALEADIAKPVEPVALLSRWISDPELGAPARVIYSVKVLDFGKSLPTGDYMLYTTPQEPAAAGWMPIETAPTGTMILMANMNAMEARSWCFVGWMVDGRVCGHRMDDPTHWMSLPAAPGGAA